MRDNITGWVVESTGSWYRVATDTEEVRATVRGKMRLQDTATTNPVAVGDRVIIEMNEDGTAVIEDVLPRENRLVRRAAGRKVGQEHIIAANIDMVWAISSVKLPRFNPGFIDRVLVMASRDDIPAGLIITKVDLLIRDTDTLEFWRRAYESAGYEVLLTSTISNTGISELAAAIDGKVSVLAGPSGVGKSSLLNAIDPALERRTGDVSQKTRKGKHITTNAEILRVGSGYVIDTPGIREFGVVEIEQHELSHHFPEFHPFLDSCKFPNCTHDHEPDCAVIDAVEQGLVTEERWSSYLNILATLRTGHVDSGR